MEQEDCAVAILKTAETPWQKSVGEVLLSLEKKDSELVSDLKWLKWLITGTFSATLLGLGAMLIRAVLGA